MADDRQLARMLQRVSELDGRRDRAVVRLARVLTERNRQHLEAMRFELAELEWRLVELGAAAPTS